MSATAPLSVAYHDPKRYLWLLSLCVPVLLSLGPLVYLASDQVWTLWLPIILVYTLLPLLDFALGEDRDNPPDSALQAMDGDRYYRAITLLLVPVLWVCFIFTVWFAARHTLPWYGWLALALSAGMTGGFGINVAHELGHKRTRLEQRFASLALALIGYGHFCIEHNRGHHRDVATPSDSASSRMGESVYGFVSREIPGSFVRAWHLESDRLHLQGYSAWSWRNEILQAGALTLIFWASMTAWLGWPSLGLMWIASAWAFFQLSSANYIEHYGLLRLQGADGKYETCAPKHSWNSNRRLSNWILFHLQRHSDHHAHAARRYQCLRSFPDLPTLPSGYFSMFMLAYVPPLWFMIMNPRVASAVGGDVRRINFQTGKRRTLLKKYGMTELVP